VPNEETHHVSSSTEVWAQFYRGDIDFGLAKEKVWIM
jgi:hypothetical protein